MEWVLELREVSKRYPQHLAVDNVSLAIPRGAFFALLGPSGCGKTTTLRLVAGFEEPTAGEILLNGRPLNGLRPHQRNVSTVFQNYALFPHLTAQANVEFGLRCGGRAQDMARAVAEVLELVQMAGKESRYPEQLSGGEKQRIALARSLVLAPEVLLLDEPLSALDPNLRKQVRSELKSLQRRVGVTFLLVTHDQDEALSMSDRIAVMNVGRLEQVGAPEEIYLHPRSRFVASFLGAVNWVGGAGVRPEAVRISAGHPGGGASARAATVQNSVFLGGHVQVEARLPTGESIVAQTSRLDRPFQAGDQVYVWWHPADEMRIEA